MELIISKAFFSGKEVKVKNHLKVLPGKLKKSFYRESQGSPCESSNIFQTIFAVLIVCRYAKLCMGKTFRFCMNGDGIIFSTMKQKMVSI